MNAPFSNMGPPEPQVITFTPAMRTLVADAIESLILLLDEIDGDAGFEEDDPPEDCGDSEPSLGATASMNQERAWRATGGGDDAEHEHDGREPDADWELDGTPFVLAQS